VIRACADREDTWINEEIIECYIELNKLGYVHSVETWEKGVLVGGLYGVSINAAFFGESMFNLVPNASKAAFYALVERLKNRGFLLLDSQYINDFTKKLGAIEISKSQYQFFLEKSLKIPCSFVD
jgi:leucyl/phenylalanyl-tRNA--protein transferase